ncbi:MAG: MscL family protein [Patescibacteria group bacterium]
MKGFISFIKEQGIVGLIVGFILGGSVKNLVTSFVEDILNPILSLFLGSTANLGELSFKIGEIEIFWGHFLSTLIDFIIIAGIVYYLVKSLRLDKIDDKVKKAMGKQS